MGHVEFEVHIGPSERGCRQFGYVYLKLQREVVSRELVIIIYVSGS